jgi:hypothetical protein
MPIINKYGLIEFQIGDIVIGNRPDSWAHEKVGIIEEIVSENIDGNRRHRVRIYDSVGYTILPDCELLLYRPNE